MNLEELQIKIGIELKELNKQLKKASDDINNHIGPKATKKLMADNNKVIKRGLDEISRTTMYSIKKLRKDTTEEIDDMSKDIHKSLTKAFDIDLTKFNKNIDSSMVQAKRSVRSACNDIRKELNAALNVKANIRVSASTSAQRQNSNSRSDTAAILASSQYTAAMIAKAINGMIDTDNKNTTRLEGTINKSTNKIVSAINKQQNKKTKTETKVETPKPEAKAKAPEVKTPEAKAPEVTIDIPEIKVPDIKIDLSQIDESINKLGETLASAISSLEDVIKLNNRQDEPVKVDTVAKPVTVKEQGKQQTVSTTSKPSVFNQPKQQPKVFRTNSNDAAYDLNSSAKMAREAFDTAGESVENFVRTLELLTAPLNPKKVVSSILSQSILGPLVENIKLPPNQENALTNQSIADLQRQKADLEHKRDRIVLPGDEKSYPTYKEALNKEIEQISEAIGNLKKSLKPIELKLPENPNKVSAGQLEETTKKVKESLEKINKAFEEQAKRSQEQVKKSVDAFNERNKNIQSNTTTATKPVIDDEAKAEAIPVSFRVIDGYDDIREQIESLNLKDVLDIDHVKEMMRSLESIPKLMAPENTDAFLPMVQQASEVEQRWLEVKKIIDSISMKNVLGRNTFDLSGIKTPELEGDSSKISPELKRYQEQTEKIQNELNEIIHGLTMMEGEPDTDELDAYCDSLKKVRQLIGQISGLPFEDEDTMKKAQNELRHYIAAVRQLQKQINDIRKNGPTESNEISLGNLYRRVNDPNKPNIGERSNNSLGFLPSYEKQLNSLSSLAKKVGSSIKKALSDALNPEVGPAKLDKGLETIETTVVNIARKIKNVVVGIAKAIKDGLVSAFNFAVNQIKKAINAIIDSLKKLGQAIANVSKVIGNFLVKHFKILKAVAIGTIATIVTALVSLSNTIAGVVTGVVIGLTAMIIKNFDKVVEVTKKVGSTIANVAKKAKNWLVIAFAHTLDVIEDKFNKLIGVIKKLASAIANVVTKVKNALVNAFNVAIDFVADKFNKLIEAVKRLASAVANVATKVKNWLMIAFAHVLDVIEDKFNKLIGVIKKFGNAVVNVATKVKNVLMNAFAYVVDVIKDKFDKCIDIIKKFGNAIANVAIKAKNWLMIAFAHVLDIIEDKFNKLYGVIKKFGNAIVGVATKVKNSLVNAFNAAIDFIVDKFNKLVGAIKRVMNAITNTVTKVKNWMMIAFAHIVDVIEDKFNKLKDAVTRVFQRISALCKGYGSVIGKHLIKWFSPITNMISKVVQSFKNMVYKLVSLVKEGIAKIKALFDKIINSIVQGFNKVVNSVKSTINRITSAIKTGFNKIVESVKSTINSVISTIRTGFNKAVESVKAAMDRVSASIKNGFNNAREHTNRAINKISSGFGKVANSTKVAMGKVVTTIKNNTTKAKYYVGGIFDSIKNSRVISSVKSTMNKVTSTIKNSASKVRGFMSKGLGFFNVGKTASQVKSAVNKMVPSVNSGLNKIKVNSRKTFDSLSVRAKKAFATIAAVSIIKFNSMAMGIRTTMAKVSNNITRYSAKIKSTLNKAFTTVKTSKLYTSVASGLNKAKSAVSKFAGKVKPILNKAFDGIKIGAKVAKGIASGLSKAKSALSKFANGCKTIWGKIKQIFHKGASDASKATGKLTAGLKGLLAKALGFFSLYGLINLGKQAITQSQTLAQAEVKLTSLMKQRMGATNETVRAIRNLAKEQANLGVVSETAMVRGAEQLSMYVHSAKALEKLMPAIANMTARRGGFNATPEDAEEIATQLGEAIREGTTTPLEQSGIYLSEAEIKKFQALRTEEERAAYLADVIAKNVGNINEALANTPHGQIAQLKNNFQSLLGTLGTLLVNVIQPIVKWLNVVVVAANNALKALGELLGFDMTGGGLAGIGDVGTAPDTGGIDNVGDSLDDAKDSAEEAEKAVEKFKGSLMGFDEINILSDNTNKDTGSEEDDPTNITPGEGGQLTPTFDPTEITEGENIFTKFGEKMKAFMDEVLEPFKAAWDELGDRWKSAWADLVESFRNACDSLANFLKSVWDNGGKEFVQHLAEIGLACGIAAMEIGGTILDALAKLWDHLDPEKNMHTQRLLDVLNEVSVKLRDFILGLNEHLENLLEYGGQDVLNAMGDCFMDLAAAAVNSFGVIIDAVDGLIDHLDPKFNQDTRNMLQATADMFHATGEAAWDFSELLRSALENGGQDLINGFGTMMVNLGETVARVITTMMESFSKFFDYIDPAKNDITREMMKSWEDAFYAIGDAALEFADLFESVMDNGGQEVLNKFGDAVNSLVGLVGDCVKEIADAFDGLFEHLDPKTNQFTQDMLSAWERAFEDIADMCGSLSDLIGSAMDNGGQELVNSVGDLGMKLGEAFGVIVEECAETFSGLFDHMNPENNEHSKKMMDALDGLVDSITEFVDACVEAFQKFMDNGGREIVNNLGDILAIVIDLAAELGSGIIDIITGFINSWAGQALIEGVATALEWVTEKLVGLSDAFDVVKDIFQNIVDIIVGVFEGDGEKVGKAFANLIKNAFKLTGELIQWLWDIGCDIVEGLVKGICALPELLWEAVQFIFDTIVSFFKELFGIHSPSTVFAELGEFLIEGLAQGITDCVNAVTDAFKKISDAIFGAIKEIKETVSEKFKEIKEAIKDKLKETKEVVSEKWGEIKQTVSEKAKETYQSAKENWGNIKQTVSDRAKETYETVRDKFKDIYETVKDRAGDTFEKVSDSWTKMKEDAGKKLEQIRTDAEKKYDQVKTSLVKKIGEVKTETVSKWNEVKTSTIEGIEKVRETAETKYESIKETMTRKLEQIKSTTSSKWEEIKKDTADKVESLRTTAEEKYDSLKEKLLTKLENTKASMGSKWDAIKSEAVKKCGEMATEAYNKFSDIKSKFTSKMDEVKSALGPKWDNLKSQASTAASNIASGAESGFNKLSTAATKALDSAKTSVSNGLSKIGSLFKTTSWSLPKIKMPHFSISGSFSLNPPSVPKFSVEWYKRGGIIDGITPLGFTGGTMHMGGEAGKEMVVPLENTSFTTKIAKAMGQAVDNAMARNFSNNNSNNNPYVNENRDVVLQVDGREFARASINSINKLQRESGRTLLDV